MGAKIFSSLNYITVSRLSPVERKFFFVCLKFETIIWAEGLRPREGKR